MRSSVFPTFFKTSHFMEFNMYPYLLEIVSYDLIYDSKIISLKNNDLKEYLKSNGLYGSHRWSIDDELNKKFFIYYCNRNKLNYPKTLKINYKINEHYKTHITTF